MPGISSASGDVEIDRGSASAASIRTASGDVRLDELETDPTLTVQTASGDVELELLSDRFYDIKTNSGSVYAPQSTRDGGMCRITTTSGDVRITVTEN